MMTSRSVPALVSVNLLLLLLVHSLCTSPNQKRQPGPAARERVSFSLPETRLHLQWAREQPPLKPAWPDQPNLQFDRAYPIAAAGDLLLIASPRTDDVTAVDADTGQERWRFVTDGPVRFAPAVWEGRAYFVSDDGYLYCASTNDGKLLWKFRGGPSDRKVLGHDRLISTWPARGAPAIADGTVYFAAGIWPFMGVFLHALDARTGQIVWTNSGDGSLYMEQPHYADSFAGIAPQGNLAIAGDKLLVPCGRSAPACYDRKTGKLVHYRLADNSRRGGGWHVQAGGRFYLNGGAVFDLDSGDCLATAGTPAVLDGNVLYDCSGTELQALDLSGLASPATSASTERRWRRYSWPTSNLPKLGSTLIPGAAAIPVPAPMAPDFDPWDHDGGHQQAARSRVEALAQSGRRMYVGIFNRVDSFPLPLTANVQPTQEAAFHGTPVQLLADGDRLFVSTLEGRICCFGPEKREAVVHSLPKPQGPTADVWARKAEQILQTTDARAGYCIAWGACSGRLVTELARKSRLHIIVIEPDARNVKTLREQWLAAGLYGERLALIPARWEQVELPPYLANLMVAEEPVPLDEPRFLRKAFTSLRPYGGVACLPTSGRWQELAAKVSADKEMTGARVWQSAGFILLSREGALPGSADWTHEHADAANTRVSRDRLVQAPLGLLWFGGPSHKGVLPRHGHGPQPQVCDGRLIIEGADQLRAVDIYTGRLLWEIRLPGVGAAFNSTWHQPGANGSGSNYVSTADGIYVANGPKCLRLDPATGKTIGEFHFPRFPGEDQLDWEYVNVSGNYLVGLGNPPEKDAKTRGGAASSKHLAVLERQTGRVLWTATAANGFRHNSLCLGGNRLFVIDRDTWDYSRPSRGASLRAPRVEPAAGPRLVAFDLRTGKETWSSAHEVFGTWLSWSEEHGVLVEAGRVARDTLYDETYGMRAYRGTTGAILWHRTDYSGPAMIHGDRILMERRACELLTGLPVYRRDPLGGQLIEWSWTRDYGCNTPAASQHLLTFRSGAAGFFDLKNDGGTGNLGGFRSGCTNNLIVAGGLLNVPDYTRTCTCSYQNQTSLALVPMPEVEMWTYFGARELPRVIRNVGLNLGAPGNRKADDGTLWLEYPVAGGPSPRLQVTTVPEKLDCFRQHASLIENGDRKWVAASGVKGLNSLTLTLAPADEPERAYTVRLHFAEPDRLPAGQRRFHVAVQGQRLLRDFDISREAGGPNRAVVKEFKGIRAKKDLVVTLEPLEDSPHPPVLCGIEVRAEGW